MKKTLKLLGASLLGLAWSSALFAGHTNFTFDVDPNLQYDAFGNPLFTFVGGHNHSDPGVTNYFWSATNGAAIGGVNDPKGGYISLVDNITNNSLIAIFPYLDYYTNSDGSLVPTPLRGFKIDLDLRVGNPTNANARAADGFSISFARAGDIAISNAVVANGVGGWAGGDTLQVAQSPSPGSVDVENGTKSGVAVVFDCWQGNYLPDTSPNDGSGPSPVSGKPNDREGMAVRVDDSTLVQILMTNRNGLCTNISATITNSCATNVVNDVNSIQTGPWSGTTNRMGANLLRWAHLSVELKTNNLLTVIWKGRTIISTNLPYWSATAGQLVLAARCGGNNQNVHVDNIEIDTTPSVSAYLLSLSPGPRGFSYVLQDFGQSVVTSVTSVILDGTNNVTAQTTMSKTAPYSYGVYNGETIPFASGSLHTVSITYRTAIGEVLTATSAFTVPIYSAIPADYMLPLSSIDTSKPGFLVRSHQTLQINPNTLRWTEEEMIGLRGNNVADQTGANQPGGTYAWEGVFNFCGTGGDSGMLSSDCNITQFGVGSATGNDSYSALEVFTYIYFPTNGFYPLVLGGDDSYQLRFGYSAKDKFGTLLINHDGSRLPSPSSPPVGTDITTVYIEQPGCLPVRVLFEQGTGGIGLEMYSVTSDPITPYVGVNDVSNPNGLLAYRAAKEEGPYIKYANPVWDAQNVVWYQPIVLDIGDGTGTKAVNASSVTLTIDGVSNVVTSVKSNDTTHVVLQYGAAPQWTNWSFGTHTNVLSLNDQAGTGYSYTWTITVLDVINTNNPAGVATFMYWTNAVGADRVIPTLPSSAMVSLSSVDTSQPGFRIKSYQVPHETAGNEGWTEELLQGLHGPNLADQTYTNGPGFFTWGGLIDFRQTASAATHGEWTYDNGNNFSVFGIGQNTPANMAQGILNSLAPTYRFQAGNIMESCAFDVATWLYFPKAGPYVLFLNSDDNAAIEIPNGSPFAKGGVVLGGFAVGRGVAAAAGGSQTGGSYVSFNVPAVGAYPFRFVYGNGGTDGGLELSVYTWLPNGSLARVPLNDTNLSYSIRAYQTLKTGEATGPFVRYANPVYGALDVMSWQSLVVEIADAPGKTVNASSIQLKADGVSSPVTTTTPAAGVTRIQQQLGGAWSLGNHTNVLVYADNTGTVYTNVFPFSVITPLPSGIPTLPLASMVPTSQVDHSKPGLLIKTYQTASTNVVNIVQAEESLAGLRGANIANLTMANAQGLFVWTNEVDFNGGSAAVNSAVGEYRYNFAVSDYIGVVPNGGAQDWDKHILAGWIEFPKAGIYAMTLNSDDGNRLTVPFSKNPFDEGGLILSYKDGSGGSAAGAFPPTSGNRVAFNVPAAGAYPFRLLWYNGAGGDNMEWTIWQYLPDGSVARLLVGDTTTPGAVKVYQSLTTPPGPYVTYINPVPANQLGTTVATNWMSQAGANTAQPVTDLKIMLQDSVATMLTNTISLSFCGVVQTNLAITYADGVTTIVRPANSPQWWPSGGFGPLILSYQDSLGHSYSSEVEWLATPFWGTLTNATDISQVDTSKSGFKARVYQLDPRSTTGSTVPPNRVHVAEQVLAGIWGTNAVRPASYTNNGYVNLSGTGPSNGVVNMNLLGAAQVGDFQSSGGFPDQIWPGVPGFITTPALNSNSNNCFSVEFLAYVEFPTNGVYTLGVASDDGFRLIKGWTPPANIGALQVNVPASLAGRKPTALQGNGNNPLWAAPITNFVTGDLVLAQGIGSGSTTNGEGCFISNPNDLVGKIALMYRSVSCSYSVQVGNAAQAGAIGVVFVQNRPATEGPFPEAPPVNPYMPIPAVEIEQVDGNALLAALNAGTNVNVTITPMDYTVNPPPGDGPLGSCDQGKGATDVLFPVVVQQAGVYPLRLTYFQGSGGGNCEFFSVTGGNRVLINDLTSTKGPGINGAGLRAWYAAKTATISIARSGSNVVITFSGVLEESADLKTWTEVTPAPTSPATIPASSAQTFYRARTQ